jgi:hypothetical protein
MTFLVPGFLYAALAVAAGIVALHFIVVRQPRSAILPTARFVPDTRTTTVARSARPTDLVLLLLRVITVLAVGAALAKPVLQPSRAATGRVILVDASRSAPDSVAMRDSVRSVYQDGDVVVAFDSAARTTGSSTGDSIAHIGRRTARGNLSAALIAALRAGSELRDRADSLELVIVSPFTREEFDAATDSVRKLWPGKARLIRVGPAASDSATSQRQTMNAVASDPIAISARLAGAGVAANGSIDWPTSGRPRWAVARTPVDTVGGVVAGTARVVAPFDRRWSYPRDSIANGEVVARWVDGEPAAIEKPNDGGCSRSVAVAVPPIGDLPIRKDFVRLVSSLTAPCAGNAALIPASPDAIARLAGSGGLAPRQAFAPRSDTNSSLAPWLLALALLTAIAEVFVRRIVRDGARDANAPATREARAA